MIDSVMFWNEPNNKSHWDPEIDPDWSQFATMINMAGQAVAGAVLLAAVTDLATAGAARKKFVAVGADVTAGKVKV